MFIVGKSFFSKILSKLNIKTIAPLCVIHIPSEILLLDKNGLPLDLDIGGDLAELKKNLA